VCTGSQEPCNHSQSSLVRDHESWLIPRSKVYFTFISCRNPNSHQISFKVLLSAFDTSVWLCIFAFIVGWPLSVCLAENRARKRQVLSDFTDSIFLGVTVLLEQSHFRAVNIEKRRSLYALCGLAILCCVVISNAYKGDNIN